MTKQEKVNFVIETLQELYPEIPIPLDHKDPYTLLVAVLLSAQCTDVRVNQITPLLFAKADNPFDMVKMTVEEIKEIIRPCGLSPMKSKGIYGLSKILIEKYNGEVPQSFEFLGAGTSYHLFEVPEGTKVARFSLGDELVSEDGADLDLYVYRCIGWSCEQVASSTNVASNEDVILTN